MTLGSNSAPPTPTRSARFVRRNGIAASALALTVGLSILATSSTATALASEPAASITATQASPTVTELAMTGAGQQRWQSVPRSRLVLNPFDRYARGANGDLTKRETEVDQNSGNQVPVNAAYYANDLALRFPELMATFRQGTSAAVNPTNELIPQPYTSDMGWQNDRITSTASGSQTKVAVASGSSFGKVSKTLPLDLDTKPLLTVDVGALSTGAAWAFEVAGKKLLPTDSTATGKHTFDLAALSGLKGTQSLELRIWVSGGVGKEITINSLTLGAESSPNPAKHKSVLWEDDFSTADGWSTGSENATLTSNGGQGIVKVEGSGNAWGSAKKDVTVNVTPTTKLAINVSALTHKWAINGWVDGTQRELVKDSTATGWTVIDDFAAKVGTGNKTISWRLFTTGGRPSGAAFDDMIIFDSAVESPWNSLNPEKATTSSTAWTATQETFNATYAGGDKISGTDIFASENAVVREVDTTAMSAPAIISGQIQGLPTWNAANRQLTVTANDYVQVYQFPATGTVGFGSTPARAVNLAPGSNSKYWSALVPSGTRYKVAVAFSTVSTSSTHGTNMTATAARTTASAEASAALAVPTATRIAELDAYWNNYLATVPRPQNFGLPAVDTYGVTGDQVRNAYYRAWINLQQNVIPATPETNSNSAQLGTGKASMWMSGIPGAKNVATWDTLVGLQVLAQADPATAWESFEGIMSFVQPAGSPFPGEISNDPTKGGEVLPSRKAQTAWILYNATGDKTKLASIYPALKNVLKFAKTNLHWTVKDRGIYNYDQRDSEFVTSLILDLEHAKKISMELGETADVADWNAMQDYLYGKFDGWFVRDNGTFQQKINLTNADDDAPVAGSNSAANGDTSVVAASLALPKLSVKAKTAIVNRFAGSWKGGDQHFAGLGDNLKGPNMNYLTAGLLDNEYVEGGKPKAEEFNESIIRDVVRAGWFAEVYQRDGNNTSDKPLVNGVRPSLFGIASFIDSIWLHNGFRVGLGNPSFLQFSTTSNGGVTGLSAAGKSYDVNLSAQGIALSGDAISPRTQCAVLNPSIGSTAELPADCLAPLTPFVTTTSLTFDKTTWLTSDTTSAVATVSVHTTGQVPQGAVTLLNGDQILGRANVVGGSATISVPALPAGVHQLQATFTPESASFWEASHSGPVAVTVTTPPVIVPPVTAQPTTLELALTAAKTRAGGKPTVTVTLRGANSQPLAGQVVIYRGKTAVSRINVPASGAKQVTLPALTQVGKHTYQAKFAATSSHKAATSKNVVVTVSKAAAKLTVSSAKSAAQAKTFKVKVTVTSPAGTTRSGKVQVRLGKNKAVTAKANAKGKATVKLRSTKRGSFKIKVTYLGSKNVGSSSASKSIRIR